MCGIVAFASSHQTLSRELMGQSLQQLIHRGPDDQGIWSSPDQKVVLGHRRLSIMDLHTGQQPLSHTQGQIHLVANGEFYDFERIRQELQDRGHHFQTQSDSEIALHLYLEQGTAALKQLRGEFAFAIYDQRQERLFAARDRFGIKPIYYTIHQGSLYLASEVKAFLPLGIPLKWNQDFLYQNLLCFPGISHTLFEGIHQLPPGHFLLFQRGQLTVKAYWDFDYPTQEDLTAQSQNKSDELYVETFQKKLLESISLRLRADVPVGVYLSGGLDSCTVLGLAQSLSSRPLDAFTLTFDDGLYDEFAEAKEMAEHVGASFNPIPIKHEHLAEHFSQAIWNTETLFYNGHGIAKFILSREVHRQGIKVVLTGEGSDEILAGYPHFRMDYWLYHPQGQTAAEMDENIQKMLETNTVSRSMLIPQAKTISTKALQTRLGFVPTFMENSAALYFALGGFYRDDLIEQGKKRAPDPFAHFLDELDLPRQLHGRDPVNQSLYLWSKSTLSDYILSVLGDRMEMANSVEGRVPFLDHHVVEFMRNVPIHLKIRGRTEKFLLRQAARPYITETIFKREKHPFLSPPMINKREEPLHQLMQDTLRGHRLKNLGIFDDKKVIAFLDSLPSLPPEMMTALDLLLTIMMSACFLHEKLQMQS